MVLAVLIPHLCGGTANYATGQRGLYAFWRVGGSVVNDAALTSLRIA